jgi:hypothetical protein
MIYLAMIYSPMGTIAKPQCQNLIEIFRSETPSLEDGFVLQYNH